MAKMMSNGGTYSPPPGTHIGKIIRKVRERQGMTQVELSEATGMHQSTISYIESGKRGPSWENARRFFDALGIGVMVMGDALVVYEITNKPEVSDGS